MEISCDWKGMLDQEPVFNAILSQRLGWHLDPGEDLPNFLETHRKLARRCQERSRGLYQTRDPERAPQRRHHLQRQ